MTQVDLVDDFAQMNDEFRPELLAHCYRMLGSIHDAEDLVQETYLRAWRSFDKFEGRSSVRTWLYRIATNVCLTALESRSRRPLPTDLSATSSDPLAALVQSPEVPWLEPAPDALVGTVPNDPAAIVGSRESIRLAFVAALQTLPPRQRAVLVLRDVLKWRAAEVAELFDTSTASVNSALQRARAQMIEAAPTEDTVEEPTDSDQSEMLERYVAAFENYDMAALVELFTEDAVWQMPPYTGWYQGGDNIARLISHNCPPMARRHADGGNLSQRAAGLRPLHARGRRAAPRLPDPGADCHGHGRVSCRQLLRAQSVRHVRVPHTLPSQKPPTRRSTVRCEASN
jgi:RNA polymerase sigma-70 factor (ECF subfamily)